ncbi:MAG TPA: SIS domain-containing protein [Candidatus Limnocylindria bacterium]|nr:SIS domain-containing protein [Candidatus Limnocylindria bacterium]
MSTAATRLPWLAHAAQLLERIEASQGPAIEQASQWCAEAIAADGLVHLFGTGHSRIPVEEMFPRYGSYPGFNPMVELSMTFHTQVVGTNGQRQAMFIERTPGLAEVILSNFSFGPHDVLVVFSASGLTAVPVEMARGARARGLRVIAVTSVAQSMSAEPEPAAGRRLLDEAGLVVDLCTPAADAMVSIEGLETPVGPGSTLAAVAIVNSIKVRVAELLTQRGAMPPVITRASVVGAERSRALFEQAYREHARRIARAIDHEGGEPRAKDGTHTQQFNKEEEFSQ